MTTYQFNQFFIISFNIKIDWDIGKLFKYRSQKRNLPIPILTLTIFICDERTSSIIAEHSIT